MIGEKFQGNAIRLAKVTEVHPDGHAVDVMFLDDATRVAGVLVLAPFASTNTGKVDMPAPTVPPGGKWDLTITDDRDILAAVAMTGITPIVLGFLYPQINQMLFDPREYPDMKIERHASDVYSKTSKDGDIELYHPSDSYVKIGPNPDHTDLTGKDFDRRWKLKELPDNHFVLSMNSGEVVIHITPGGDLSITAKRTVTIISVEHDVVVKTLGPGKIRLN